MLLGNYKNGKPQQYCSCPHAYPNACLKVAVPSTEYTPDPGRCGFCAVNIGDPNHHAAGDYSCARGCCRACDMSQERHDNFVEAYQEAIEEVSNQEAIEVDRNSDVARDHSFLRKALMLSYTDTHRHRFN
jgi:hypothetical protein